MVNESTSNLEEELKRGEYEAQFFDTSAVSLAYSLKELVKTHVQKCLEKLKLTIEHKVANPDELKKANRMMDTLNDKYKSAIEQHCKNMESKIYEIFNIPSHVLLPEDANQMTQYTDNDEKKLDEEIEQLKSRYLRAICMEGILKKRRKTNKCVDLLEKTMFEINKDIDMIRKIFETDENNYNDVKDELKLYEYLDEVIHLLTNNGIDKRHD